MYRTRNLDKEEQRQATCVSEQVTDVRNNRFIYSVHNSSCLLSLKKFNADLLKRLTVHVLIEIEKFKFTVNVLVADNLPTNVKLDKMLIDGRSLSHVVKHPLEGRPDIYLRFDPSQIIKNVSVQFMKRGFSKNGKVATGEYVKRIYKIQKEDLLRPVRRLMKKHIDPTNFEKQNVRRAVDISGAEKIAALDMYSGLGNEAFVGSE